MELCLIITNSPEAIKKKISEICGISHFKRVFNRKRIYNELKKQCPERY